MPSLPCGQNLVSHSSSLRAIHQGERLEVSPEVVWFFDRVPIVVSILGKWVHVTLPIICVPDSAHLDMHSLVSP
ncbi:hypothetical protein V6N13_147864 [Hibiscus sabdariffa]|uniref:Uncharacterized protein n=1 Tax=Hibiscus sabdariffa TaxID=183260 RepID=A0ABR2TXG2_9ROSI